MLLSYEASVLLNTLPAIAGKSVSTEQLTRSFGVLFSSLWVLGSALGLNVVSCHSLCAVRNIELLSFLDVPLSGENG